MGLNKYCYGYARNVNPIILSLVLNRCLESAVLECATSIIGRLHRKLITPPYLNRYTIRLFAKRSMLTLFCVFNNCHAVSLHWFHIYILFTRTVNIFKIDHNISDSRLYSEQCWVLAENINLLIKWSDLFRRCY